MSVVVSFPDPSSPRADLERLEARISTGLRGSFDAGEALKQIRDDPRKLYRVREDGRYQTFEAYCQGVWGMTPRHAGRLIDASDTFVLIGESGPRGPLSPPVMTEKLLRPLASLSAPQDKIEAFNAAVQIANDEGRPMAARHVALAVSEMRIAAGWEDRSGAFSSIIKPTDNWNFNPVHYTKLPGEEDSHGYIPGEFYANCLWYYTKPGDLVAAPMAGSGMIIHVYEDRKRWAIPEPWDLDVRMSDLNPRGLYEERIAQHDITTGLPPELEPDYIVMDVPYFGMVEGQYSDKTDDLANMNLASWSAAIRHIAFGCSDAQKDGSMCTVLCPNYADIKAAKRVMASKIVERAFEEAGYEVFDLAYVARHIQQDQTPGMGIKNNMAKRNKTMLTDMAIAMTFMRTG